MGLAQSERDSVIGSFQTLPGLVRDQQRTWPHFLLCLELVSCLLLSEKQECFSGSEGSGLSCVWGALGFLMALGESCLPHSFTTATRSTCPASATGIHTVCALDLPAQEGQAWQGFV